MAAEDRPVPKPKPEVPHAPASPAEAHWAHVPVPKPAPNPKTLEETAPVRPREKPVHPPSAPEMAPVPRPPVTEEPAPRAWSDAEIAAAKAECGSLLSGLDLDYKPLAPLGAPGGCGAPAPIEVTRVAGVSIAPAATLTCKITAALHTWIVRSVQPEAAKSMGEPVAAIANASAYVCRRRNGAATGKMSEHAYAAAFDVGAFTFSSGRKVPVMDAPPLAKAGQEVNAAAFLAGVRAGACRYFSTVLGPGSNAAHAYHFHFDLARGGRYLICE
ncbi:extensin family protein [Rhodoligotrophos defluvii]|uniref:extensin-like domain-containing protein n=1 Tax=Rhodoligotrophos defluvii TaxID=2561934 RepID=UPI0014852308|nr:extensin family protein [Rhodoligotrophos defluvii]